MELKLFIWEHPGCLADYTDGIIFALAPDVEAARQLVRERPEWVDVDSWDEDLEQEPTVFTTPIARCRGGGS